MKLLVLQSDWNFNKFYKSAVTLYRSHKLFWTVIEIFLLICAILACGITYILIINKASTEGYSLKQVNSTLSKTDFQYRIVKTNILDLKQQNWEKITSSNTYWQSMSLLDSNIETVEMKDIVQHTSW